jgi:hypothetical protein
MHHLKAFLPDWKAFCFAHSLLVVESRINFRVANWKMTSLRVDDADYGLTDSGAWILISSLSSPLRGV